MAMSLAHCFLLSPSHPLSKKAMENMLPCSGCQHSALSELGRARSLLLEFPHGGS